MEVYSDKILAEKKERTARIKEDLKTMRIVDVAKKHGVSQSWVGTIKKRIKQQEKESE